MKDEANPIGQELVDGIISGIEKRRQSLEKLIDDLANTIIKTTKQILGTENQNNEFNYAGQSILDSISDGMYKKEGTLMNQMYKMFEQIIKDARQNAESKDWQFMGQSMIDGLINGINNRSSALLNTVQTLIDQAIKQANAALQIASPSKVFARMGEFTGEGFIEGVKGIARKVYDTVHSAFSGFDTDALDAQFNVRTPALAGAGAGGGSSVGRSGKSAVFNFYQNITVGEGTSRNDAKRIGKQIYQDAKEVARSKGVDIL